MKDAKKKGEMTVSGFPVEQGPLEQRFVLCSSVILPLGRGEVPV